MTKTFRLSDPKLRQRAVEARLAASRARGNIGYGALVTAIVLRILAAREMPLTAASLQAALGGPPTRHTARIRVLVEAGYITRTARGAYALTDKVVDERLLRPRDLKIIAEARAKLDAPPVVAPPPTQSASGKRALQQAVAALAAFARYGARIANADPSGVPMLLRSDGLRNGDFQAAQAAREALLAAIGEETKPDQKAEPDQADLARFLG